MRKLFLWFVCILAFFCLVINGCDLKERFERPVDAALSIDAGQKLVVCANVGSIKVTGGSNHPAGIKAKITGKADTLERARAVAEAINIVVEKKNDSVIIKIDKPLAVKNDWFEVDYVIDVPENIDLKAGSNVGSVTVTKIKGNIVASNNVGSITCQDIGGKTNLKTNVGNIDCTYATDTDSKVEAKFSVDVGDICFKGPRNMSAKLDVSTNVGSICSDLPVTVQGNICMKKLSGTAGQGKGNVQLCTNVGSIHIK